MVRHSFTVSSNWPGRRNDVGTIKAERLQTSISIPPEMDGPGIGTNPDEMLLGAAATCYIITLAAMLERSSIEKESLTMESEGIVDVTNGVFTYEKIIHRPHIVLPTGTTEIDRKKVERLAKKAETSCMISRAIAGNVALELHATIDVI
ncbi:OsmC family protein [Paenisporosarcina cavernae]|uniref:OsmC family peroxiredoxin n=1 Tax=Paenisporosarcina cavernae TaxID=2320858 RepID=A0A385YVE8_9BACL|nr:OsmC family protein [Paenisporosarcina cavernae]AYC30451.1 OsmC family peroxiredoxin [Paenisporosarcina cavernae]